MTDIRENTVMEKETIIREPIEWTRSWVPNSDVTEIDKPRVLLVGDSIVMGYGPKTSEILGDAVSLAWVGTSRFPADPAYYDEISLVLKYTKFDAVHFNNGLHGFGYEEEQYDQHLQRTVWRLRELTPDAVWMLANSTPVRKKDNLSEFQERNDRVLVRNQAMAALARKNGLPLTDLYAEMENYPEYYSPDGTHFNETGIEAQARLVAARIRETLNM